MDINNDLTIARDYRILMSIVKHGIDVIPYDFEFLSKYELKQLFLTYLDISTSGKKQDVSIAIIKKHICDAAFTALPDNIEKYDNIILNSFSHLGFEFINSLFKNLDAKIINDFLFQHCLFQSYREFMDALNFPDGYHKYCALKTSSHLI